MVRQDAERCYVGFMKKQRPTFHSSHCDLWSILQDAALDDNGAAARSHLNAGRPIYFGEIDTPTGLVVKEYPDGRKDLVRFDEQGEHCVICNVEGARYA